MKVIILGTDVPLELEFQSFLKKKHSLSFSDFVFSHSSLIEYLHDFDLIHDAWVVNYSSYVQLKAIESDYNALLTEILIMSRNAGLESVCAVFEPTMMSNSCILKNIIDSRNKLRTSFAWLLSATQKSELFYL